MQSDDFNRFESKARQGFILESRLGFIQETSATHLGFILGARLGFRLVLILKSLNDSVLQDLYLP